MPDKSQESVLRLEGEYWTAVFDGLTIRLRDGKPIRYLVPLLRRPGERLHVCELRAVANAGLRARRETALAVAPTPEQARLAVTKGLAVAIDRIRAVHPTLGAHLAATIRRGYRCTYLPDPRRPIHWTDGDGRLGTAHLCRPQAHLPYEAGFKASLAELDTGQGKAT